MQRTQAPGGTRGTEHSDHSYCWSVYGKFLEVEVPRLAGKGKGLASLALSSFPGTGTGTGTFI